MCVNWKIVGGALAGAVVMVLFAPGWGAALAPLLVVAICPLSMLFMMRYMHGPKSSKPADASDRTEIERLRSEVAELRRQRSEHTSA